MRSAVVLAGGRGSRLGFQEKALLSVGGRPLLCRVFDSLQKSGVDEIVVSVRDTAQAETLEKALGIRRFAFDRYRDAGPLAGILAGLEKTKGEHVFVCACDMPFIQPAGVEFLFKTAEKEEGWEAVIPKWRNGRIETLHAVYARDAMARETEKALENGEKIILAPLSRLQIKYIPAENIPSRSFVNINTPQDASKLADANEKHI